MLSFLIALVTFIGVWLLLGVIGFICLVFVYALVGENIKKNHPKHFNDIMKEQTHMVILTYMVFGPVGIICSVLAFFNNLRVK
jgi:magnesium-transporting ATPase (P-type)